MQDYEKLGSFYLGRSYDLKNRKLGDDLVLYDSKDLVTHAVCVGMTGSGKTGLCIDLLEEAAIDGIPSIVIDPKGDLANLLLTFPELKAEDFEPWVNEDDARKKNLSRRDYASKQAELWRNGLADWEEGPERIAKLRSAAELALYTPGSNAGLPVSILKSFAAPAPAVIEDAELLRERIGTTAASLLGMLGIQADPIKSREHILISTILNSVWRQGHDLDLGSLIQQIQNPPMTKIGVLDLESFYPSKERFELVVALNNMLAAPGFSAWLEGEPLDVGQILYGAGGKPRVAIFSIAHLSDAERMFFVSLLLNQVLGWMRTQSGTSSLRAILYMDEIFGYFPPVANPPSKVPLLTLLKQARAYGLGIVLATQNPVDLDYKGLSNTGTWFIGRLQTERDKARVLEGLEGAAASIGTSFDRQRMEETLAALGNRVFLMNNAHEDAPIVFQTRWALSYLAGPLTRTQIKILMDPYKAERLTRTRADSTSTAAEAESVQAQTVTTPSSAGSARAAVEPGIAQFFIPARGESPDKSTLIYCPMIIGSATVRFVDAKAKVDSTKQVTYLAAVSDGAVPVEWKNARAIPIETSELEKEPAESASYADLPAPASQVKNYARWTRDFTTWLYGSATMKLLKSSATGQVSSPDENERDFRIRIQQAVREERDAFANKLREKYASKAAALQERIRRAQLAVQREEAQATDQKLRTAVSFGATLIGAFFGRKAVSVSNLGRATAAARGVSRSMSEQEDIKRATENVQALEQQLADLNAQFESEVAASSARLDAQAEQLEEVVIKPKKTNIVIELTALAWAPHWRDEQGRIIPAWE
jgi:hypothetical protein